MIGGKKGMGSTRVVLEEGAVVDLAGGVDELAATVLLVVLPTFS